MVKPRDNPLLTYEEAAASFRYCADTGNIYWKVNHPPRGGKVCAGDIAGHVMTSGYRMVRFNGVGYLAHRLAWLLQTGEWPKDQIDHINRVLDDNQWSNLRKATHQENNRNRGNFKRGGKSMSQFKGVQRYGDKWLARIWWNGWRISLGRYNTEGEAADAYEKTARLLFRKFSRAK